MSWLWKGILTTNSWLSKWLSKLKALNSRKSRLSKLFVSCRSRMTSWCTRMKSSSGKTRFNNRSKRSLIWSRGSTPEQNRSNTEDSCKRKFSKESAKSWLRSVSSDTIKMLSNAGKGKSFNGNKYNQISRKSRDWSGKRKKVLGCWRSRKNSKRLRVRDWSWKGKSSEDVKLNCSSSSKGKSWPMKNRKLKWKNKLCSNRLNEPKKRNWKDSKNKSKNSCNKD